MKYILKPGEIIPPFYGIAYQDWQRNRTVCYPLVINLAIILWRDLMDWLRNPKGERR